MKPLHFHDDGVHIAGFFMPLPFPGAYQVLFWALFGGLIIYPLLSGAEFLRSLADLLMAGLLFFGALASSTTARQFIITMIVALFGLLLIMALSRMSVDALVVARLYAASFMAYVAYVILHDVVVTERRVNTALIYGALCAYLLFALVYANFYAAINAIDPGAITGITDEPYEPVLGEFTYFSFVTLTTLGYGDMVPVAPFARAVAYTEALGGQIYLTVIVARVVALYITDSRSD